MGAPACRGRVPLGGGRSAVGDDAPTLTTSRLHAVPVTLWNAAFVAEELAQQVALAPRPAGPLGVGGLFAGPDPRGTAEPAALRRELRYRAAAGRNVMTWVVRGSDGRAIGLLGADTRGRRAAVAVSVGPGFRRRGYGTEIIRAVAGWLETHRLALVEARVRTADVAARRLAQAAAFEPTRVMAADGWQIWCRRPVR